MFMTADELRDPDKTTHGDLDGEDHDSLFEQKLDEAWDNGLRKSINDAGGVRTPVTMSGGLNYQYLIDGHHRTAVAHERDPQSLVPVLWRH